jgi:hypothetical protein
MGFICLIALNGWIAAPERCNVALATDISSEIESAGKQNQNGDFRGKKSRMGSERRDLSHVLSGHSSIRDQQVGFWTENVENEIKAQRMNQFIGANELCKSQSRDVFHDILPHSLGSILGLSQVIRHSICSINENTLFRLCFSFLYWRTDFLYQAIPAAFSQS